MKRKVKVEGLLPYEEIEDKRRRRGSVFDRLGTGSNEESSSDLRNIKCSTWLATGSCPQGVRCPYRHDPPLKRDFGSRPSPERAATLASDDMRRQKQLQEEMGVYNRNMGEKGIDVELYDDSRDSSGDSDERPVSKATSKSSKDGLSSGRREKYAASATSVGQKEKQTKQKKRDKKRQLQQAHSSSRVKHEPISSSEDESPVGGGGDSDSDSDDSSMSSSSEEEVSDDDSPVDEALLESSDISSSSSEVEQAPQPQRVHKKKKKATGASGTKKRLAITAAAAAGSKRPKKGKHTTAPVLKRKRKEKGESARKASSKRLGKHKKTEKKKKHKKALAAGAASTGGGSVGQKRKKSKTGRSGTKLKDDARTPSPYMAGTDAGVSDKMPASEDYRRRPGDSSTGRREGGGGGVYQRDRPLSGVKVESGVDDSRGVGGGGGGKGRKTSHGSRKRDRVSESMSPRLGPQPPRSPQHVDTPPPAPPSQAQPGSPLAPPHPNRLTDEERAVIDQKLAQWREFMILHQQDPAALQQAYGLGAEEYDRYVCQYDLMMKRFMEMMEDEESYILELRAQTQLLQSQCATTTTGGPAADGGLIEGQQQQQPQQYDRDGGGMSDSSGRGHSSWMQQQHGRTPPGQYGGGSGRRTRTRSRSMTPHSGGKRQRPGDKSPESGPGGSGGSRFYHQRNYSRDRDQRQDESSRGRRSMSSTTAREHGGRGRSRSRTPPARDDKRGRGGGGRSSRSRDRSPGGRYSSSNVNNNFPVGYEVPAASRAGGGGSRDQRGSSRDRDFGGGSFRGSSGGDRSRRPLDSASSGAYYDNNSTSSSDYYGRKKTFDKTGAATAAPSYGGAATRPSRSPDRAGGGGGARGSSTDRGDRYKSSYRSSRSRSRTRTTGGGGGRSRSRTPDHSRSSRRSRSPLRRSPDRKTGPSSSSYSDRNRSSYRGSDRTTTSRDPTRSSRDQPSARESSRDSRGSGGVDGFRRTGDGPPVPSSRRPYPIRPPRTPLYPPSNVSGSSSRSGPPYSGGGGPPSGAGGRTSIDGDREAQRDKERDKSRGSARSKSRTPLPSTGLSTDKTVSSKGGKAGDDTRSGRGKSKKDGSGTSPSGGKQRGDKPGLYEEFSDADDDLDDLLNRPSGSAPGDDTGEAGTAGEEKPKPPDVADILKIDWKSLVDASRSVSSWSSPPGEGKVRKTLEERMRPGAIFTSMGLSARYVKPQLYNMIKQECAKYCKENPENEEVKLVTQNKSQDTGGNSDSISSFDFLDSVALIHSHRLNKAKQQHRLLSDVGPYRRALCARQDMLIRKVLASSIHQISSPSNCTAPTLATAAATASSGPPGYVTTTGGSGGAGGYVAMISPQSFDIELYKENSALYDSIIAASKDKLTISPSVVTNGLTAAASNVIPSGAT